MLYSLFILLYLNLDSVLFYFFFSNAVSVYAISTQFFKALNQMASISNELTALLQAGKLFVQLKIFLHLINYDGFTSLKGCSCRILWSSF